MMDLASPIYDMRIEEEFKMFSMLDNGSYSGIYDDMYRMGVSLREQRTASLLNKCAGRDLSVLVQYRPDMYDKLDTVYDIDTMVKHVDRLNYQHTKPDNQSWRSYCLNLISENERNGNTDAMDELKFSMMKNMLAWKYLGYTIEQRTYLCLMCFLDEMIKDRSQMVYESWDQDDIFHQQYQKNGLDKHLIALSHLPDASIECQLKKVLQSMSLDKIKEYWGESEYFRLLSKDMFQCKDDIDDVSMKRLYYRYLKESVKSTANWKLFTSCLLRNDYALISAGERKTYNMDRRARRRRT